MYIDISLAEVIFNDLFVLLSISPGDDEIVLTADKPIEFFKPVRFSNFVKSLDLSFDLFDLFGCVLLGSSNGFFSFLPGFLFFD